MPKSEKKPKVVSFGEMVHTLTNLPKKKKTKNKPPTSTVDKKSKPPPG